MAKGAKKPIGRFVTFILIVALVLGVILTLVFISLFTPKSTKALAENVNDVVTSGYLSDAYSEKISTIDDYLDDVSALCGKTSMENVVDDEDVAKIANYQNAIEAYKIMGQFFAREMLFTTYTDVYGSNANAIKKSFSSAQNVVDELIEYLEKNLSTASGSNDALALTWQDSEEKIDTILSGSADAMERLMDVYLSCVNSTLMNNGFSDIVFKFCKVFIDRTLLSSTSEDFDLDTMTGSGETLYTIADLYLTEDGAEFFISYPYDSELQKQVAGLNAYYENNFLAGKMGG